VIHLDYLIDQVVKGRSASDLISSLAEGNAPKPYPPPADGHEASPSGETGGFGPQKQRKQHGAFAQAKNGTSPDGDAKKSPKSTPADSPDSDSVDEARQPTFKQARAAILDHLRKEGWSLSSLTLKIPHATAPSGLLRLWFKAQAVYFTKGNVHKFNAARTVMYDLDIRQMDGPKFLAMVQRAFPSLAESISWRPDALDELRGIFHKAGLRTRVLDIPIERLDFIQGALESDDRRHANLSDAIQMGEALPPLIATPHGNGRWRILDGHHRILASVQNLRPPYPKMRTVEVRYPNGESFSWKDGELGRALFKAVPGYRCKEGT
jgi:hypothetical protein